MEMKPSVKINEMLSAYEMPEMPENCTIDIQNAICISIDCAATYYKAILEYLDENIKTPKYACPSCDRVVDEVIKIYVKIFGASCVDINDKRCPWSPTTCCKYCRDKFNEIEVDKDTVQQNGSIWITQ